MVDAYPPRPISRRCIWTLLMTSSLLLLQLQIQQGHHVDSLRWSGDSADIGSRLPWESIELVAWNDTFDAAFVSPIVRRAATFLNPRPDEAASERGGARAPAVVTGLPRLFLAGGGGGGVARPLTIAGHIATEQGVGEDVVAVARAAGLPRHLCGGAQCYIGVERMRPTVASLLAASKHLQRASSCHRFVFGSSAQELRPIEAAEAALEVSTTDGNASGTWLCVGGKRIHSIVVTPASHSTTAGAADGGGGEDGVSLDSEDSASTVVVAWDPPVQRKGRDTGLPKRPTCLAVVPLFGAEVGNVALVDGAATIVFDRSSWSVVTVGYSDLQMLTVSQLDPLTLAMRWRYRLPLAGAWVLGATRLTDGFLLLLGAEEPFAGSVFAIDLKRAEVYEQDPPLDGGQRWPRRRKLEKDRVAERVAPLEGGTEIGGRHSACAAAILGDHTQ